jgi:hypothetical protein
MLTCSKPNAIVPDKPLHWILTTLRFYAIVASVGIALAFAVISILAVWAAMSSHYKDIAQPIETGQINRIEGGGAPLVVLILIIILFAAATYFTGSLYGNEGTVTIFAGIVVIVVGLMALAEFGLFG